MPVVTNPYMLIPHSGGGASDPKFAFVKFLIQGITDIVDVMGHSIDVTSHPGSPIINSGGKIILPEKDRIQRVQVAAGSPGEFTPGALDWCFEAFATSDTSNTNYQTLFDTSANGSAFNGMFLEYSMVRGLNWFEQNPAPGTGFQYTGNPDNNEHHIAVYRNGGFVYLGYDGLVVKKVAIINTIPNTTNVFCIGNYANSAYYGSMKGAVRGIRYTLGDSRYPVAILGDTFAVPSMPYPEF